jgi:pectate lyase
MKGWMRFVFLCLVLLSGLNAAGGTRDYLKKPDSWFAGDEARRIAESILSWQSKHGGWPKNIDVTAGPYTGDRDELKPTFDNRATTDELRFLARICDETHEKKYQAAFERGFDYILDAQYPTGGWPQFSPPGGAYHRHITFNDDAMVRLMNFLRETWEDDHYDFLDRRREKAARKAFDDGLECILKCQVKVDGKLTAWCAQHDETTYEPRPARAFELVSLSGSESAGILRLLMSLDKPDERVAAAVDAAVAWFETVRLTGIRLEKKDGNLTVAEDRKASPLWARFYEIGTNRPFFCGRDGIKKYDISEIEPERRNGYAWYGDWPQSLLENEYPGWKRKNH